MFNPICTIEESKSFYQVVHAFLSTPNTEFFVEFPEGPLAVGEEPLKSVDEHKLTKRLTSKKLRDGQRWKVNLKNSDASRIVLPKKTTLN
jgi:hypothetical protein